MAPTIKEIARLAGVSRGTVDRVIHNRAGVSPEVRESVERILREMDYAPNAAAVALKSAGRKMTVGVIVPDLSNEFYYEVYDGIQDAVKRFRAYGITTMEYKMPTSTEEALLLAIDTLMEQKVDALALQAMDAPAIEKRMAQLPPDFPVVTFNSDFSHGKRMCFVGQDSFAAGRVAGKMLGLRIPEKGKVAIFIGRAELVHQRERESGFRQAMAERGCTAELIGPFETKEDESRAYTMASQLIAQEPGLVGIYAAGGGQKNIAAALAASGRAQEIVLVGHDLLPKTVEYLQQGVVDCTIAQEPYFQGYMPLEILSEYLLFGIRPSAERLYTTIDIRIKENVSFNGLRTFRKL